MDMTMFRRRGLLLNTPHIVNESGSIVTFDSAYNKVPIKSLICSIEPIQEGTGNPSPDNVRPISGRTGLTVSHSGTDTSDPATISVSWETEAGTVYGGTLDVVSGKLVVNRAIFTESGSSNILSSQANRFYIAKDDALIISAINQTTEASVISDRFISTTWAGLPNNNWKCSPVWGAGVAFVAVDITTAQGWKDYFTQHPTQFSYKLETPTEIQLTPQEVKTLLGENNIWCNSGDISIDYWKWGN